jgi:glutathione synthase/RimK-type ligase-like ATP-grasp enzyme
MKSVLFLQSNREQTYTFVKYLSKTKNFELYFDKTSKYDKSKDFDYVIPCGVASTSLFLADKGYLKIGQMNFSENNFITYDKIRTLKIVDEIGVPIPKTFTLKKDVDKLPVFFKSLREDSYRERGVARTVEDLIKIKSKTVFFQELITTPSTYSVGYLADNGKIVASFAQKEVISVPYHGGSAVVLERWDDPRLHEYTARIVEKIGYSGWGLAEYKYCDRRNDFVFMEINAKFWASIEFTFINNPLFLKLLFDIDIKPKIVKKAVFLNRVIQSDLKVFPQIIPHLCCSKWLKTESLFFALKERLQNKRKT